MQNSGMSEDTPLNGNETPPSEARGHGRGGAWSGAGKSTDVFQKQDYEAGGELPSLSSLSLSSAKKRRRSFGEGGGESDRAGNFRDMRRRGTGARVVRGSRVGGGGAGCTDASSPVRAGASSRGTSASSGSSNSSSRNSMAPPVTGRMSAYRQPSSPSHVVDCGSAAFKRASRNAAPVGDQAAVVASDGHDERGGSGSSSPGGREVKRRRKADWGWGFLRFWAQQPPTPSSSASPESTQQQQQQRSLPQQEQQGQQGGEQLGESDSASLEVRAGEKNAGVGGRGAGGAGARQGEGRTGVSNQNGVSTSILTRSPLVVTVVLSPPPPPPPT